MIGIIYDSTVIVECNGNYYSDNFANGVIRRYAAIDPEVMYIMPYVQKDTNCNFELINYSIVKSPILKGNGILQVLFFQYQNRNRLQKYISKCDKLIIRMPSPIGVQAIRIANKLGKNYLVELVGDSWGALWYHSLKGKVAAPFFYSRVKHAIRKAKNVQYITEEFLQSKYPTLGNSFVCPNTAFPSKDYSEREFECINNKEIVLCSVGNISVRYKGHATVLKAISDLKKKGYNVRYYLIGGGSPEYVNSYIERLDIEQNVVLTGQLSHEEVYSLLGKVDIYIQPSFTEAQGRSLLEAMNESCPCLCSDVGGMRELIQSRYRFPPGDSDRIVEIIEHLNDAELKDMAKNNWTKAREFSAEKCENARRLMYCQVFEV